MKRKGSFGTFMVGSMAISLVPPLYSLTCLLPPPPRSEVPSPSVCDFRVNLSALIKY